MKQTEITIPSHEQANRQRFFESFPASIQAALRDDWNYEGMNHLRTLDALQAWLNVEPPAEVPACFSANLSWDDVLRQTEKQNGNKQPSDIYEVLGPMMVYCGVSPSPGTEHWVQLATEYPDSASFPYATLELFDDRRVPMRAVPPSFQYHPQLRTPFILEGSDESARVVFDDGTTRTVISEVSRTLPPSSARTIAYMREKRDPEDPYPSAIRTNPILGCGERCSFCYRQYDLVGNKALGATEKVPLSRIIPEDIVRYSLAKFNRVDPASLEQFGVVTGSFLNFDDLHAYTEALVRALAVQTNGQFDPIHNNHQSIPLLTHLATSKDQMQALKTLGVKHLEHTLELVSDERRAEIMPRLTNNPQVVSKGSVSFDDFLNCIPHGKEVFGDQGYSTTLLLGLDDARTTQHGITAMSDRGLKSVSYPVFQAYTYAGMKDYAMSFDELMQMRRLARQHFSRQY